MFLDELLSSPRSNHENAAKLGRIFRGHTCGGPPYLDMRAPEWHSGESSLAIHSSYDIVDTKTI